jgi:hypothetical protein
MLGLGKAGFLTLQHTRAEVTGARKNNNWLAPESLYLRTSSRCRASGRGRSIKGDATMFKTFIPICSAAAFAAILWAGSAWAGIHLIARLTSNPAAANSILVRDGEAIAAQAAGEISGTYSVEGVNPDGSAYSGTVVIKAEGSNYQFTWQIAGETFKGVGSTSGDTIVVKWGQKDPVIYNFGSHGVLNGKWDEGRATETLTRMP